MTGSQPRPDTLRVAIDAHVVGRHQTGNERYTVNLANALAQRDDVHVIALVDRGAEWPAVPGRAAPQIEVLRVRQPQLRIPVELPLAVRRLEPDLLQVNYVAPPLSPVPVVTVIHDLSFEDLPHLFSFRSRFRLQQTVRRAARQSAAVICVSRFTQGRVIELYGPPPRRVHFVPEGVDERWRPLAAEEVAMRIDRLRLPQRFVLAAGTDHPRKNLPRLIRAVARARATGAPDLELVLCGPAGSGAREVEAAIRETGGRAWVTHLGFVDDEVLHALYCAAAAFAYVSLYEGFGLPVLEALACGAVVVASSTTSIPEVAGDAALLVEPHDVESIASALVSATTDEDVRRRMRTAGPQRARKFTWARAAERTVDVYRQALRESAR